MNKKRNILFLLSHQPNPRFVKQISYLSKNSDVSVVYYYRDYLKDLSSEYINNIYLNENIGNISNGNYLQRIGKYIKSIKSLYAIVKENKYDILIANNIDTLALFKLCTIFQSYDTKIAIEISDLRSHTYIDSFKSKAMRTMEKFMFKFVDKIIVTSPKFYDMYYNTLFKDEPFVLENKPLSNMIPARLEKKNSNKVIIGIVGLLLQGKPYQTLFEAIKDNDKYEVHIYGKGIFEELVNEYANKYENIKFFGEYNFFQDSAKIYSTLDILYMPYDTTNGSLNNRVALPNKLYEAMYFRVPVITSKGTYLGELIENYSIGQNIVCCKEKELRGSLQKIIENKALYVNALNNLDKGLYMADDDYLRLEEYIIQL